MESRPGQGRLLLLMTILAQTLFALVRGHLVSFSFLSAGHCTVNYLGLYYVGHVPRRRRGSRIYGLKSGVKKRQITS